jgi:hypothetical protein
MKLVGVEFTFGIDQSYFILITPEICRSRMRCESLT